MALFGGWTPRTRACLVSVASLVRNRDTSHWGDRVETQGPETRPAHVGCEPQPSFIGRVVHLKKSTESRFPKLVFGHGELVVPTPNFSLSDGSDPRRVSHPVGREGRWTHTRCRLTPPSPPLHADTERRGTFSHREGEIWFNLRSTHSRWAPGERGPRKGRRERDRVRGGRLVQTTRRSSVPISSWSVGENVSRTCPGSPASYGSTCRGVLGTSSRYSVFNWFHSGTGTGRRDGTTDLRPTLMFSFHGEDIRRFCPGVEDPGDSVRWERVNHWVRRPLHRAVGVDNPSGRWDVMVR